MGYHKVKKEYPGQTTIYVIGFVTNEAGIYGREIEILNCMFGFKEIPGM